MNKKKKEFPHWEFSSKKSWLRNVRKRWVRFRKPFSYHSNKEGDTVKSGCVYYPPEVMQWLGEFEKMDKLMREYYKNA